ncbi:MAG: response regulator, partial [Gammaproteobacteria bacterium]
VALLSDPRWPHPLADSEGPGLEERLARPELIVDDQEAEPRQTVAQAEDVSLTLPEDVNAQLLESLLQELPNETAEFTEAVSRMLAGGAGLEELDRAQRIAHTLKGSANTVGVVGIATLTHHIEDILLAFSKHQRLPGAALLEVLIDAADVLEMMSEALVGTGSAPDQAQAVLQRVLDWANRIDAEGLPEDDAAPPEAAATPAGDTVADKAGTSAARADASAPMLRVPATLVDELLRLAGESIILNGQLQERLRHSLSQTEAAREQNRLVQQLVVELEELVDVQGLNSPQARAGLYEKFDALELEQYNELHTVTHRLVEATTDARELTHGIQDQLDDLAGMLVDQGRLNKESHEVVMRTRMVPVQTIVPRLQRSVRQTGRLTGKQAQLEVSGVDTLMDSDVLNELADPLMHILRNAIDHGIEPPEARAAAGKDPIGRIDLSFHREGDHIVLRCRDDGAGLDLDTIRRTAQERGLIDGDDEPTDDVLMRLVWLPGFSTREVTTQTSGRGIGMDAVYSRVTELKGTLNIDSRAGKGCTVELRLPLTLISVHALLVRTRGQALAVSTRGVEQILHPGDGSIERDDGQLYYRFGETRYEAHFLETLLHQPINNAGVTEPERPVLLVRGETGRTSAVLVEQVGGSQDLVVKQLSQYLPSIAGIEGATILGDGSVAPVLDLSGLLRTTAPDEVAELAGRLAEESGTSQLPCALVVDDSLSARRSLAQFVQDAGFEVRTARDGLEAIDVIADRAPDVLLVDLEMPRMNGLELTAHVRARADLREVPIIMITSRSTEKHRQQAEEAGVDVYLTKPFSEDDLLGHITQRLASA